MKRIVVACLSAALVLWGGFTAFALWGDNYQFVLPAQVSDPQDGGWRMIRGQGGLEERGWVITRPGRFGQAMVGIDLGRPVTADAVGRIELELSSSSYSHSMRVGWSRRAGTAPARWANAEMERSGLAIARSKGLAPSEGLISFFVIELLGPADGEFVIQAVRFRPSKPGFLELQRRVFGQWLAFPPWTQASANQVKVSLERTIVSPVLAFAAWVLVSVLFSLLLPGSSPGRTWLAVGAIALVGWVLLDLRWQADLAVRAVDTVDRFAGKSRLERRQSDVDGELFEFVEGLRDELGDRQRRLFALGESGFWRVRARYHGLPWSTRSSEAPIRHDWSRHLKPGDVLLLLDAPYIERVEDSHDTKPGAPFDMVLTSKRVAGRGSTVGQAAGAPVLRLRQDGQELVRAEDIALPAEGFYRVAALMKGGAPASSARIIVRWTDANGKRFTVTERAFAPSDEGFGWYEVPFVLNSDFPVSIFVVGEKGTELAAKAIRIEAADAEGLMYLRSSETGPYLVVRPVSSDALHEAYEVL